MRITRNQRSAFTIPEVVFAMVILTLATLTCVAAVNFSRVASQKAKEQAIALDFVIHYLETVRGLRYQELRPGVAVNNLYNGTGGAPNIRLPASGTVVNLNTPDYQIFHPDLTWLAARRPEMRVTFTERSIAGVSHDKLLHVEIRWQPPLGRGSELSVSMDAYRVRDL